MKTKAIRFTTYSEGSIAHFIIPRKVTQTELLNEVKTHIETFGKKAKLLEYEIVSVNVELNAENVLLDIATIIQTATKTPMNETLYIM